TSVAVHQYTYQHVGPWTQHAGPSRGLLGTLALPVDCLGDFGPRGLSVQYTHDVRGCLPAHTGRPTSVGVPQHTQDVCVCPSAHTTRLWLSISTHISTTLGFGLSTLALPMDCLGILAHVGCLFSAHRTSVGVHQHTHDVRGCPWLAHTGRLWLSVCDVRSCPCVSVSTHRTSVAVHQYIYQHAGHPWVSVNTHRMSVCVRQHTQDVRGCPCMSVSHTGRPWMSISTHISTLVLGLSTLALPVDSRWPFPWTVWVILAHVGCLFRTHGTSVGVRQHTHDVGGCLW
ncbi:unnamed protein product, partial [Brassica rapa]